jgi:pimeloyl-ACP methyl ester carboxylesterase
MVEWTDGYWTSKDGLRLHYRDYAGRGDRPPILCIPGLTRNARDFGALADRLAGEWRLILVELRGRGESERAKDPMSYLPATYLEDLTLLLDQLALDRFILFGTSLGGLLSILITATQPGKVAGVLLNDIGPAIEAGGLGRIKTYVGKASSYPTWLHAARSLAEVHHSAYPDYTLEQWLEMAKRLCRLTNAGRIVADYDGAIAEPFKVPGNEAPADLWPLLDAMKPIPSLLVRGAISDILSAATADRMVETLPLMERVEMPRIGHAPTLFEPEVEAAIDRLLARVGVPAEAGA